jgi:hypothetical protein
MWTSTPQHRGEAKCACGATLTVTTAMATVLERRLSEFYAAHTECPVAAQQTGEPR